MTADRDGRERDWEPVGEVCGGGDWVLEEVDHHVRDPVDGKHRAQAEHQNPVDESGKIQEISGHFYPHCMGLEFGPRQRNLQ